MNELFTASIYFKDICKWQMCILNTRKSTDKSDPRKINNILHLYTQIWCRQYERVRYSIRWIRQGTNFPSNGSDCLLSQYHSLNIYTADMAYLAHSVHIGFYEGFKYFMRKCDNLSDDFFNGIPFGIHNSMNQMRMRFKQHLTGRCLYTDSPAMMYKIHGEIPLTYDLQAYASIKIFKCDIHQQPLDTLSLILYSHDVCGCEFPDKLQCLKLFKYMLRKIRLRLQDNPEAHRRLCGMRGESEVIDWDTCFMNSVKSYNYPIAEYLLRKHRKHIHLNDNSAIIHISRIWFDIWKCIAQDDQIIYDRYPHGYICNCKYTFVDRIFKLLHQYGADIHADNDTLLMNLARTGHDELCEYIIQDAKNRGIICNIDRALIHCTKAKLCEKLIGHGADIHIHEDLPLVMACRNDDLTLCQLYIKHGANVHANNDACMRLLLTNSITGNDHDGYYSKKRIQLIKLFVENGCDTSIDNWVGLRAAVQMSNYYLMEYFAQLYTRLNLIPSSVIRDCLRIACENRQADFILDIASRIGNQNMQHLLHNDYELLRISARNNDINTFCAVIQHLEDWRTPTQPIIDQINDSTITYLYNTFCKGYLRHL